MIPARRKRRPRVRKLPEDPLAGGEPSEVDGPVRMQG